MPFTKINNTNTDSALITSQTEKTSLVDGDKFLITDSASSNAFKYVQKSNLGASGFKLLRSGSASSGDGYATLTGLFTSTYKIYKISL